MPQPKKITETYTNELRKTSTITIQYGEGAGGTASSIPWDNDDLMHGLRIMFNCQNNETIESVSIDQDGIRASFRRKERG